MSSSHAKQLVLFGPKFCLTMIIIRVEFELYVQKVIVLADSRERCVFHVDTHKVWGGRSHVDRGRGSTRFLSGHHKWMTPYALPLIYELLVIKRRKNKKKTLILKKHKNKMSKPH